MEEFAIRTISKSYNNLYSNFIWHDKDDDFDFTSQDDTVAIEVATILPINEINAIQYENALEKGKNPNLNKVINAQINDERELLTYYGGSMSEIRKLVIKMIKIKEVKRVNRIKKYIQYELCLCINEGGLFNTVNDFDFIIKSGVLNDTGFSKLFLITCRNFYVISNNKIKEYRRIC